MKTVVNKLEDTRTMEIHIDRDNDMEANYRLGNDVILLVEEIGLGYKWNMSIREWQVSYVNLDGWRKDKAHRAPWWIWGNALTNWASYPWLAEIVEKYKPKKVIS